MMTEITLKPGDIVYTAVSVIAGETVIYEGSSVWTTIKEPIELQPGVAATVIDQVYRPVLGYVYLLKVTTSEWTGWLLLTDEEITRQNS